MQFEFATASRILFGPQGMNEVGSIVKGLGRRCLVVTGHNPNRAQPLQRLLEKANIEHRIFSVSGEPSIEQVSSGVRLCREFESEVILGFGGGSAIDSAKAIAGLSANAGEALDYLEVIGGGKPLLAPGLPCIAVPTTAGTGAEVTRNSVLSSPEHHQKVSLRSRFLLPAVALVDPLLTCDLPPALTASTGLDALTQLIEPYVSSRANPLTDALCREGLERVKRSLPTAFLDGNNQSAREDMALASLFGGLALANAGLGAVHGFAGPIGGMFPAPHGAICAALLPAVSRVNIQALKSRSPEHPALGRYDELGRLLSGKAQGTALDLISWVTPLCLALEVKPLRAYGMRSADILLVVEKAKKASSMRANPITLTDAELTEILEEAI